jgi:hypothetical protein
VFGMGTGGALAVWSPANLGSPTRGCALGPKVERRLAGWFPRGRARPDSFFRDG